MSSEDVKAEEIILKTTSLVSYENDHLVILFFFQHERGEEKNCSWVKTVEQVVVLFVGCTNLGRRIFWAFHYFSVSSIIWVLQDCWGEVRKCQLMLCVITIENQRTVFGQSLFASKLLFFFTVLVSAKDEYEQYFLLGKKKDVECTEKNFFSVYVSCLDRWGKPSWQNLNASSIFLWADLYFIVVQTSSGRDSLYASFSAGTTGIHTKTICSETKWLRDGVVFSKDLLSVLPGESG